MYCWHAIHTNTLEMHGFLLYNVLSFSCTYCVTKNPTGRYYNTQDVSEKPEILKSKLVGQQTNLRNQADAILSFSYIPSWSSMECTFAIKIFYKNNNSVEAVWKEFRCHSNLDRDNHVSCACNQHNGTEFWWNSFDTENKTFQ